MRAAVLFAILSILSSCSLLNISEDYDPEIVFSADDEAGTPQIYTMNGDGSNVTRLTHYSPEEGGAVQPSWSPDGSRIIFSSFYKSTTIGPGMWVMDADGRNRHPLHPTETDGGTKAMEGRNARWSPDGTKVVFDLCPNCQVSSNSDIYLYDIQTQDVSRLTQSQASDSNPVWSPDGTRIAFVSNRDHSNEGGTDIYLFTINEGKVTRLTKSGNAGRPLWSPSGEKLLYWSENNLYWLNIGNMSSELIPTNIDNNNGFRPLTLSPDGKKILLIVFSYSNPRENESLQILNYEQNNFLNIYSGTSINNADWLNKKNKSLKNMLPMKHQLNP